MIERFPLLDNRLYYKKKIRVETGSSAPLASLALLEKC